MMKNPAELTGGPLPMSYEEMVSLYEEFTFSRRTYLCFCHDHEAFAFPFDGPFPTEFLALNRTSHDNMGIAWPRLRVQVPKPATTLPLLVKAGAIHLGSSDEVLSRHSNKGDCMEAAVSEVICKVPWTGHNSDRFDLAPDCWQTENGIKIPCQVKMNSATFISEKTLQTVLLEHGWTYRRA